MKSHTPKQTSRHGFSLALLVTCSIAGTTQGYRWTQPLAFAPPRIDVNPLKKELDSEVRLFTRGPDSQLSASTLAYAREVYEPFGTDTATDPFDPNFRPLVDSLWGTPYARALPVDVAATPGRCRIFCDLDGVLVDFEAGVRKVCRQSTAQLAKTTMWRRIAKSNTAFFAELPWTADGPKLWNAIRHLKPDILTGVPELEDARVHKFLWCRRHLGLGDCRHVDMAGFGYHHANVNGVSKACPERESDVTNIITCWSYNKHHESGHGAILIDDRIALKAAWEAKGGIFVHHKDAESTLRKLKQLGVLDQDTRKS